MKRFLSLVVMICAAVTAMAQASFTVGSYNIRYENTMFYIGALTPLMNRKEMVTEIYYKKTRRGRQQTYHSKNKG